MRLRLVSLCAAAAALLAVAPAAQAASLHIADAEVTVAQGQSAGFTIALTASGALTCRASATVAVDSLYSVNSGGEIATGVPANVTFEASDSNGNGNNCDPTWDGAPDPYALAATATAAIDTPLGDYTSPVAYEVQNAPGTGPAGKLSNAGAVNVTIHVVAPEPAPVIEEPAVELPPLVEEAPLRPTLGKTVMLSLVSGNVVYRSPGEAPAELDEDVVVPNGTRVDATNGVVKVTVEREAGGELSTADAWGGAFVANQAAVKPNTTVFALSGPLSAKKPGKAAHASRAKKKRFLWVNSKGNFKTRGKRASAISRGTFWLTEDTSETTKVSVKRGAVAVRDFVKNKTVLVTKGHTYTARKRHAVVRRVPAFTGSVR